MIQSLVQCTLHDYLNTTVYTVRVVNDRMPSTAVHPTHHFTDVRNVLCKHSDSCIACRSVH